MHSHQTHIVEIPPRIMTLLPALLIPIELPQLLQYFGFHYASKQLAIAIIIPNSPHNYTSSCSGMTVAYFTPLLFWLNCSIFNPLMWRRNWYWSWTTVVKVGILYIVVTIINLRGRFETIMVHASMYGCLHV